MEQFTIRSKEEKRKNCVDLLKQLFPMDDPDNCEDLQDIMDGFGQLIIF